MAGTATPGVDYTNPGAGKATFAAGSSKATITLPTKDDLLSDPNETIITTITAPVGYTISGPNNATSTILDNDGNAGNNNLVGTSFADALAGVGGNDTLSGLGGNDTLDGGANNDTYLFDTDLVLGSDRLIDASGIDTLNFAATTTKTINLNLGSIAAQTVTAGNLTLTLANATAFENVIGGSLNDNIIGNTLANSLSGGAGSDTLNGGLGVDTLTGGVGNDFFRLGEIGLANRDLITDFSVPADTIILANSLDSTLAGSINPGIKGLLFNSGNVNGSVLSTARFFKGAGSTGGASGNLSGIYVNTSNGDIWYNDSNLVGSYLIANVGAGAAAGMTNLDFVYGV
ncbi:hypothetical protein FXO09_08605 [Microcystis aeruginosa KLA2]|nr:hypothetical protein FXO09_08605 [Microcystis aeruginosa KLA2]